VSAEALRNAGTAELQRHAERAFSSTRALVSKNDRDNHLKCLRAVIVSIVVNQGLEPSDGLLIFDRAEKLVMAKE
jgi:hypothetical protein